MSAGQLAVVAALLAVALIGIPSYALGWWNGRRCLRAVLDARRLPPLAQLEVRVIRDEPLRAPISITCPRCGRISYNPEHVAQGYCGACHDWTSPRAAWAREDPFPTTPMRLGSEHRAGQAVADRFHAELLAQTEREVAQMIDAAERRDPYRRRH